MFSFLGNQILLYIAIILVLFLPGYFLLLAIFGKKNKFDSLEKFVLSFGLSIIITDILLIFLNKFSISINKASLLIFFGLFFIACYLFYYLRQKNENGEVIYPERGKYSRAQTLTIVLVIFISIFFRTAHLAKNITPSATDLGHHMYWVGKIVESGEIPAYQKVDIIEKNGSYGVSEPGKIDDFIIGEHLIFAAVGIISGASVISAFPVTLLFLINIIGLLAIFILAKVFFDSFSWGKNMAILSILFLGGLYALSAPQGNFISGGVVGNLIGNLFVPLAFYLLYRAIKENSSALFALGIFTAFGLIYAHHLTTFIFGFALAFSFIFLLLIKRKGIFAELKKISALVFSAPVILTLLFGALFFFFVLMPGYIENQAVKTVIGKPSRSTKEGLALSQLQSVAGESRLVLGIIGVVILLASARKYPYQSAIISGWFFSIFLLSWKPTLLHIDIPSSRIGNYLIFPAVLAGAFGAVWFFEKYVRDRATGKIYLGKNLFVAAVALVFLYVLTSGLSDINQSFKGSPAGKKTVETFAISRYLAERTDSRDAIVKDHNYVPADSWMKVFFMRDYNYPFTRGLFFRYDGVKKRELCTLWMISTPNSPDAKKCFDEIGIDFIVVNPNYDNAQFKDTQRFWRVYASNNVDAYYYPNN
ncbi:MAG: DUF6541 family protein [Parcubacteria group bacterium]